MHNILSRSKKAFADRQVSRVRADVGSGLLPDYSENNSFQHLQTENSLERLHTDITDYFSRKYGQFQTVGSASNLAMTDIEQMFIPPEMDDQTLIL